MEQFVPLYRYPVDRYPADRRSVRWSAPWRRLIANPGGAHVVLNVHNGPGPGIDMWYRDLIDQLRQLPLTRYGYIALDYAARPVSEVLADQQAWAERYGIQRLFLDEFPSDPQQCAKLVSLIMQLRTAGASTIVGNPGTEPAPATWQLCDLVVTRELPAREYLRLDSAPEGYRADRSIHLVHSCLDRDEAAVTAQMSGVRFGMISRYHPPHPWRDLGVTV